jgi:nucleoside-diphosphate kinase
MQIDSALAEQHYAEHVGKPFFPGLVKYITSGPVAAAVFEGTNAIQAVRGLVGATNPAEAAPGSIRADLALEKGRNLVHASDSPESGTRESQLFFKPEELLPWSRDTDKWIFE